MTNAKEAAERLRLFESGKLLEAYGSNDHHDCYPHAQADDMLLSQAWRAENLPDDDELITEEWLNSESSMNVTKLRSQTSWSWDVGSLFIRFDRWMNRGFTVWIGTGVDVDSPTVSAKNIQTRGQLRRLIAALQPTSEANRE